MHRRRWAAVAALVLVLAAVALAIAVVIALGPRGLIALAAVLLSVGLGWHGITHRGTVRVVALVVAVVVSALAVVFVVSREPVLLVASLVCLWLALGATRAAFCTHVTLPAAEPPKHAVLFFNPKSGGGKAERFHLGDEARRRGMEAIELERGADLETLVRAAVARGADGLAMAGGDGSQAIVAAVAAEHGLPYACIPAGTRNHFALDLGVDRDDVVGALDAFVDGGERIVDLAEINGRVFVNNVSLGLYAEAVQREGYRDAKLRTLLETVPDVVTDRDGDLELRWRGPDGAEHDGAVAVLVSNNQYRLGRAVASGTRPRIDEGQLGVTVFSTGGRAAWRQWTVPAFEVDAGAPVAAGIDGEAMRLAPPLRFAVRPAALRVRVARAHPGASPSALQPDRPRDVPRTLVAVAAGRA